MAELFADFDLDRRAPRARRVLRTLAGSIALHAVLILCMIYVPAVRDALQLADTLAGLRIIDDPNYKKAAVHEQGDVTIINLADSKFYYPPGYFEVANGEVPAAAQPTTPPPANDVRLVSEYKPAKPTPTATPTPVPVPAVTPSPAATPETAQNGQAQAAPGASPTASPSPQTAAEIDQALQAAQQEKFPVVNTAPFTDLLKKGKKMKDTGELNLAGTLELTVEADRLDDGSLDNIEVMGGGTASDAKLRELATEFVRALGASKVLVALKQTHHLRMNLLLDEQRLNVRVITEVASPEQAKQLAQGYSLLIAAGQLSKKGHDEEAIFKGLRVLTNDREISLNFSMPRQAASDLLSKLSKKAEAGPSS